MVFFPSFSPNQLLFGLQFRFNSLQDFLTPMWFPTSLLSQEGLCLAHGWMNVVFFLRLLLIALFPLIFTDDWGGGSYVECCRPFALWTCALCSSVAPSCLPWGALWLGGGRDKGKEVRGWETELIRCQGLNGQLSRTGTLQQGAEVWLRVRFLGVNIFSQLVPYFCL